MHTLTARPLLRLALVPVAVVIVLAVLAACQGAGNAGSAPPREATVEPAPASTQPPGSVSAEGSYWPTLDWRTADPAKHRVDGERLAAMMDDVKAKGLDLEGVVVIRDGYIVFEQYPRGLDANSRNEVYSVTKSFASTLIGIAQRKGLLTDLDAKVLDLLPGAYQNMDARKQAMTLDDVLTMRSGLEWTDDDPTITAFATSRNPVKFMLDRSMVADPGTAFNYCSGCSSLLTEALTKATGMRAQDFAQRELLSPLGITRATWQTGRDGVALGGWGMSLTAREMAKLGYLFLREGEWDGEQIVSPEWVRAATAKHTTTDNANGYGYQWWTHPQFPAYMALGRFGQTIYINPQKDLVVAIRAQLPNHDAIYDLIENYIEPAVK